MPIGKASWRTFSGGMWVKGPPENVPSGALRRALNIHVQRDGGSIRSRSGTAAFVAATPGLTHTLETTASTPLVGVPPIVGITNTLSIVSGGVLSTIPAPWLSGGANPSGLLTDQRWDLLEIPVQFLSTSPNIAADLAQVSGAGTYVFVSRAGIAFKFSSVAFAGSYWGIDAPAASVVENLTVTPNVSPLDTQLFAFANVTNTTGAGPSGFALSIDTNRFTEGASSHRLDCPRDSETMETTSFAPAAYTPKDLTAGGTSSDEDYISFWVHVARPANVKSINIKFFVQSAGLFNQALFNQDPNTPSTSTAPYTDYYHTEMSIQVVKEKRKRQLLALGDFVPFDPENKALKRYLAHHPPDKGPDLDALQFLNPKTIAVSRNTWTKVTIPKGLFDRSGKAGQANFTWANVVGFQLSVETEKSGNTSVWFDDLRLAGGVGTRGDYLYTITYRNDSTGSRSNPPYNKAVDGTITIATTPSVTLDRQSAAITGIPAALNASHFRGGAHGSGSVDDDQVTHIEIWRTVGNGNPGKSNALFNAPTSLQMFLVDKIAVGTTSYTDTTADYPGMHSLQGAKFLNSDQEMEFDNMPPWSANDGIGSPRVSTITQAVYHPPTGRVFFTDSAYPTRVFISAPGRPESLQDFIEPTSVTYPIQRLVIWNDNLWIFTSKGVQQLQGTDRPFFTTPAAGVPGTVYPYTVLATPFGIFYVSQDGARLFDGQQSRIVADDALAPLFRGTTTVEGIPAFTVQAVDGHTYGPQASWGRDEVLLTDCLNNVFGYHPASDSWRIINVPFVTTLHHPPDGLVANGIIYAGVRTSANTTALVYFDGTSAGEQSGEVGEVTTDAAGVSSGTFNVRTPSVFVSGENQGIVRLLYVEANTQSQVVTVNLILDGTTLAVGTISSSTKQRFEFNINRVANIAAVEFVRAGAVSPRIEISSIELEVYESAGE
jgi:hypothetical protein